jgi:hypothetical protein
VTYDIIYNIVYDVVYDVVYDIVYDIIYNILFICFLNSRLQDNPFRLDELDEFDPLSDFDMTGCDDVWFSRPQLFFMCSLCPTGQIKDKSSHREVSLVSFSTFEPISLPRDRYLQKIGIPMLFEPAASQLPTLYVCPVESVLGRVPLLPCYMMGNRQNTIPHALRYHIPSGAAADSRPNSGTGSRLFEVNIWMWHYGRAFPRKISVKDADEMRRSSVSESRRRGAETLKRRRLAAAERQQE